MDLFRIHAFAVVPHRTASDGTYQPEGGAVAISADLRTIINDCIASANFPNQLAVDFRFESETRTNGVRDLLLEFAFGAPPTAKAAGQALAVRLAEAMDGRSAPCLFVPTAAQEGPRRFVTLWIFPRDTAFRLKIGKSGPSIQVLSDVFSQRSTLRKAASFEGRRVTTEFLSGQVLDYQAGNAVHDVAEFWIVRFLDCQYSIHEDTGTRLLAKTIKEAYDKCSTPEAQEQLYSSIVAVRSSPRRRISLQSFADDYLDGEARAAFLDSAPADASRSSRFNFRKAVFDSTLKFRIFQLERDVFVSSPFDEIGKSVRVDDGDGVRTLQCKGKIVEEKVRSRRA